jgi:hypothetical protein
MLINSKEDYSGKHKTQTHKMGHCRKENLRCTKVNPKKMRRLSSNDPVIQLVPVILPLPFKLYQFAYAGLNFLLIGNIAVTPVLMAPCTTISTN